MDVLALAVVTVSLVMMLFFGAALGVAFVQIRLYKRKVEQICREVESKVFGGVKELTEDDRKAQRQREQEAALFGYTGE